MMIAVSNSTPLIALSRLNKFGILQEYFGEVYIPKEVYEEVVIRGRTLFGAEEVASAEWIKIENVKNRIAVESLSIALDKGEAEAIVLAKEKEGILVIDDSDGRRIAESLYEGTSCPCGSVENRVGSQAQSGNLASRSFAVWVARFRFCVSR